MTQAKGSISPCKTQVSLHPSSCLSSEGLEEVGDDEIALGPWCCLLANLGLQLGTRQQ